MTTPSLERSRPKILVIDDNNDQLRLVKFILEQADYAVYTARDGSEGLLQFQTCRPELVILDLIMPDLDGWQVCRHLRQVSPVPILMLTAVKGDDNIISGLDVGADDYLEKPFKADVLLARVRALLRRAGLPSSIDQPDCYNDGYLTLDLTAQQVFIHHRPLKVSRSEFKLLAYLYRRAGQICLSEQLLGEVWGYDRNKEALNILHLTIQRLRRKLGETKQKPRYLWTEHGLGYRFRKYPPGGSGPVEPD